MVSAFSTVEHCDTVLKNKHKKATFDVPEWSAGNVYVLCICCQVLVFEWSFWNLPQQWWFVWVMVSAFSTVEHCDTVLKNKHKKAMFDVPEWSAGNVYVLCICCQVLVFEWSFWNLPEQWWIGGICFSVYTPFPPPFPTTSCKPKYLVFNPTINTITNTNRVMGAGGGGGGVIVLANYPHS